jgi:trimeric autotransporter adhesin
MATATGGYNTIIGNGAGYSNTIGNTNTFIGNSAGRANTTGFGNTFIGCESGNAGTNAQECIFIGYRAGYYESGDRKLYIDVSETTSPILYGDFGYRTLT